MKTIIEKVIKLLLTSIAYLFAVVSFDLLRISFSILTIGLVWVAYRFLKKRDTIRSSLHPDIISKLYRISFFVLCYFLVTVGYIFYLMYCNNFPNGLEYQNWYSIRSTYVVLGFTASAQKSAAVFALTLYFIGFLWFTTNKSNLSQEDQGGVMVAVLLLHYTVTVTALSVSYYTLIIIYVMIIWPMFWGIFDQIKLIEVLAWGKRVIAQLIKFSFYFFILLLAIYGLLVIITNL